MKNLHKLQSTPAFSKWGIASLNNDMASLTLLFVLFSAAPPEDFNCFSKTDSVSTRLIFSNSSARPLLHFGFSSFGAMRLMKGSN